MGQYPKVKRTVDRDLLDTFHEMRCVVCNRKGCDPAHLKTRGSGGDDVLENLIPLCRQHHTEQGQIGFFRFIEKYPKVGLELEARGWGFDSNRCLKRL